MATPRTSMMSRRGLLGSTVPLALAATGCGWILYPGRRGRSGGSIDIPVLIIDLLWLIPGLVPGAICLIVDFTTGCIYGGGGRGSRSLPADSNGPAVAVLSIDDAEVAHGEVQPDWTAALAWNQSIDGEVVKSRGRLVVHRADGAVAQAFVRDLL